MFNKDQIEYMNYLLRQPRESLCECGWYKKEECLNFSCEDGDRNRALKESKGEIK